MTEDLLAKEREFHRLNRELGQKTKELMREVDTVLISHSTTSFPSRGNETPAAFDYCPPSLGKARRSSKQIEGGAENPKSNEGNVDLESLTVEEIVSREPENSRNDIFVRFLKAKIKLLHDELQTCRLEYKKKCGYCKELETENKKLEEAKLKLHNNLTGMKDSIAKLEANNSSLQTDIQAQGTEVLAQKKEIEGLKKELKTASQQSSNLDVRLNRSLEENERLRNIIKSNKIDEKELRDQIRRLQESSRIAINKLERQRGEVLQAFKKQTFLVDNLKKQKAILEASRMVQVSEEEFKKILDWDPSSS